MRILLALGECTTPRREGAGPGSSGRHDVEVTAAALAAIVSDHEAMITHTLAPAVGRALELALRNALPERDVVSVLTQVVVAPQASSLEPHAIAEIHSLRYLLASGALVICAGDHVAPVALDRLGTMHELEAKVDQDLTAALLARRLDADLLMMPTDPHQDSSSREAKAAAARRFVEATGRPAAIGSLAEMIATVRGGTLAA